MPNKIPQNEIESLILKEEYHRVGLVITAYLTTVHGFIVTGESGTIDPNNFNEEIGQSVARRKAIDELWKLEGYHRVAIEAEQGMQAVPIDNP